MNRVSARADHPSAAPLGFFFLAKNWWDACRLIVASVEEPLVDDLFTRSRYEIAKAYNAEHCRVSALILKIVVDTERRGDICFKDMDAVVNLDR